MFFGLICIAEIATTLADALRISPLLLVHSQLFSIFRRVVCARESISHSLSRSDVCASHLSLSTLYEVQQNDINYLREYPSFSSILAQDGMSPNVRISSTATKG